ncbi:arsenate reductase (glutaredoxin) [Flavobacterium sp. SUN052]|uniref:arsenate reductase (glutaredoxin) n=1 Tax=Flavobacterium sp. SUN052 TaxID=3002441 RepID=UPI00237DCC87|nr:arsenate reductase (glutaredoxin) [Flavobacterium sp. SUN052]MEC4005227.1 arsenate reductase (glutaredoxin) [Flavobacterium sp. SUN052]
MITIYHNPRCGKSRECLAFIANSKQQFEVIKYLETPLTFDELSKLIVKLNLNPIELVRTKESIWKEKFKGNSLTEEEIIQTMVDYPILMERPIAVKGSKAIIARPFERLKEII